MKRVVLKITSSKFENGGQLPKKYSCLGINVNPPIAIEHIPAETQSLAVVMESCDKDGVLRTHWVAWNIPVSDQIIENENRGESGLNDFKSKGYWGPDSFATKLECTIRVYALDRFLKFPYSRVTKFDVQGCVRFYGLGHGKLVFNYSLKKVLRSPASVGIDGN